MVQAAIDAASLRVTSSASVEDLVTIFCFAHLHQTKLCPQEMNTPVRLEIMISCKRSVGITVYRYRRSALADDEWQINSRVEIGKHSDLLFVIVFGGYSYAGAKIDNRKQDVRSSSSQQVE